MGDEFINRGIQATQSNDPSETPNDNEENRLILNEIHSLKEEKEALEFERETEKRLRTLAELAKDMKEKFFRNLNILKYYQKKSTTEQRMCKVSMRVHGQCRRELQNLEEECSKFRNHMGKTEEELCASNQIFNGFIIFIKQAKPTLFQ